MLIAKKRVKFAYCLGKAVAGKDGFRRGAQNIARALHLFSMFGNLL